MATRPKLLCVVGTRPNFVKAAALLHELRRGTDFDYQLVHTGQHYDDRMSGQFFDQLGIPKPDLDLGVGSGSHAVQTARIMEAFEPVVLDSRPDMTVVFGDVNSTVACAVTSVKLGVPVAHVEAGLRSFDRTMPEEINRVLTDSISEVLFTTEPSANENLRSEGIAEQRVKFVGNVMIDTLLAHRAKARESAVLERMGARENEYVVLTLHRPANVDSREVLEGLIGAVSEISETCPVIFPCRPRTLGKIEQHALLASTQQEGPLRPGSILVCPPLGYLDFMKLVGESKLVVTDSGGLQEETTILGVPCLTLRDNTERPATVTYGTNEIVGLSRGAIVKAALRRLSSATATPQSPPLWDGRAAHRIVRHLADLLA